MRALTVLFVLLPALAAAEEAVRHEVRLASLADHRVEVETQVPGQLADGPVMMAVWTPGSDRIREFPRHIESLEAVDRNGTALAIERLSKNRWRVAGTDISFANGVEAIAALDVENLTPIQAMQKLAELREQARAKR